MKYQLIVIGGGPAGYTAAEIAAKAGLKVLLIERCNLGGVCLNEGCIPTKTLLYSAKTLDNARFAAKYGVTVGDASIDLPKVVSRKNKVVRKLVLGIKAKLANAGVTVLQAEAYIVDSHHVRCDKEVYQCDKLLACTGSETIIPSIEGIQNIDYWTHREALNCSEAPATMVVVGGGVIGMEFAAYFNSLGTKVTVIEMQNEILGGMDSELSALLRADYTKKGVKFLLNTSVTALSQDEEGITVTYKCGDAVEHLAVDKLLMSVGRRPVNQGFGLENLGLKLTERGHPEVDAQMQSSQAGVYICGDLTGFSLLAHTAVREAEVAVNHILGRTDEMSYRAIPGVVYTNPEFAGVGATEESLTAKGIAYKTIKIPMAFSGRFVAENEGENGVCKLLLAEDTTVLGAHVLGNPASEIITLAGMAIEQRLTAHQWMRIVVPHPTVGEIFREALASI